MSPVVILLLTGYRSVVWSLPPEQTPETALPCGLSQLLILPHLWILTTIDPGPVTSWLKCCQHLQVRVYCRLCPLSSQLPAPANLLFHPICIMTHPVDGKVDNQSHLMKTSDSYSMGKVGLRG